MKRKLKAADISKCIPLREVPIFDYTAALELVKPQAMYSKAFLAGEIVDFFDGHAVFDVYYTDGPQYFWGGLLGIRGFSTLEAYAEQ